MVDPVPGPDGTVAMRSIVPVNVPNSAASVAAVGAEAVGLDRQQGGELRGCWRGGPPSCSTSPRRCAASRSSRLRPPLGGERQPTGHDRDDERGGDADERAAAGGEPSTRCPTPVRVRPASTNWRSTAEMSRPTSSASIAASRRAPRYRSPAGPPRPTTCRGGEVLELGEPTVVVVDPRRRAVASASAARRGRLRPSARAWPDRDQRRAAGRRRTRRRRPGRRGRARRGGLGGGCREPVAWDDEPGEQLARLRLRRRVEGLVDGLGAAADGAGHPADARSSASAPMWPSTRRSYSSVSVNCSSGSEPGWAAASATRWATTPRRRSRPRGRPGARWRRRAGSATWATGRMRRRRRGCPISGCCSGRSNMSARNGRDDAARRRRRRSTRRATTSRNSSRRPSAPRVQHSSNWSITTTSGRARRATLPIERRRIVVRLRLGGHLGQRRAQSARPDRRRGPSWRPCAPRCAAGERDRHARPSSCPNRTRRRPSRDGCSATVSASASTTAPRPKNAAASASSNGRRPLYGLTPAAVASDELPRARPAGRVGGQPLVRSRPGSTPSRRPTAARQPSTNSATES